MKLSNLGLRPTTLIPALALATLLTAGIHANAQEWASAARQEGMYASWSQQAIPPSATAGQPISIDQAVTPTLLNGQGQVQAVQFVTAAQEDSLQIESITAPQGQPITSSPTPEAWLSNGTSNSGVASSDGTFGGPDYGVTMGGPVTVCGACNGMGCNTCGPLLGCRPYVPFVPAISRLAQALYCGPLQNMTFHAGSQGFTNPKTTGNSGGGFGFHEGFQYAVGLDGPLQIGFQGGLTGVHSVCDTNGGSNYDQLFWTVGLFHRGLEGGLQWSIVYDGLSDKTFADNYDLGQIRTEIGFSSVGVNDFGFYGAFNTGSVTLPAFTGTVDTYDVYAVYYRRYWCEGGVARFYAGTTNHGNGVLNADCSVPLSERCSLAGSFTCLFDNGKQIHFLPDEAWNVSVGIEYSFGGLARQKAVHPFRPTLNVADNGSMISRFVP